jgi:SAM-dependent methyltransferase
MPDNAALLDNLTIFQQAVCWKAYWTRMITPHTQGRVLEVGAGFGANTPALMRAAAWDQWYCLEPDPEAFAVLAANLPPGAEAVPGSLESVAYNEAFDTILYIDVLEHIRDDRAELVRAAAALAPGGCLIVLAPAHPWLFTAFDAAIGHHRRYTRASLLAAAPPGLVPVRACYLDSAGLLASLGSRLFLKKSRPGRLEILFWDRVLVRMSHWTDPLTVRRVGKSVLAVWKKPSTATPNSAEKATII